MEEMSYEELVKEWAAEFDKTKVPFHKWIAEKVTRLEAERDSWRKQALAEDERANAMERRVTELEASRAN